MTIKISPQRTDGQIIDMQCITPTADAMNHETNAKFNFWFFEKNISLMLLSDSWKNYTNDSKRVIEREVTTPQF